MKTRIESKRRKQEKTEERNRGGIRNSAEWKENISRKESKRGHQEKMKARKGQNRK